MGKKRWHREAEQDREALWPLSAEERYISVDIEADGPVPGLHSMLSLGAVAAQRLGAARREVLCEPRDAPRRHHRRPHDGVVEGTA